MKKAIIGLILLTIGFTSCKDSTLAQYRSLGTKHLITQYGADGKEINKWESTGNVSNSENSDGWYFEDVKTHKLVEITGTIKIEQE